MWESVDLDLLQEATLETLHMVGISTLMTAVLGIPLGVLLVVTDRGYFWENLVFQRILAFVVNIFRAVPFIILVLFLFPVAKLWWEPHWGRRQPPFRSLQEPLLFMRAWWKPPSVTLTEE